MHTYGFEVSWGLRISYMFLDSFSFAFLLYLNLDVLITK